MPAESNQSDEEQPQQAMTSTQAAGQERLTLQAPSIEIAEAGDKLALAEPSDVEALIGTGGGHSPLATLPDVAPPYHDEAADNSSSESDAQFNPLAGDQTAPLPTLNGAQVAGDQPTTPLNGQLPAEDQTAPLPNVASESEDAGDAKRPAAVTTPLSEAELPEVAAPPRGDLVPLERDTLVDGRYAITNLLQSQAQGDDAHNVYRCVDERSAEQCWVCGSVNNKPGELYCANCGAQLANKVYWLRESWANGVEGASGAGLLLSKGLGQTPGFGRIFRSFRENRRDYELTEEGAGQSLTSFAPLTEGGEPVGEEKLLGWAISLTAALRPLHEAGLALGSINAESISIIGGELPRINDATAAHEADTAGRTADVQALAQTLSQFAAQPVEVAAVKSGPPTSLGELLAQAVAGQYADASSLADALEQYREEGVMPPTLTVLAASGSDVGMVRKLNEDSVLLIGFNAVEQSRSQPFALLTVADGMGGHDSGEVASSMAIRAIAAYIAENVLGRVIFNYGTNVNPQLAEGEIDVMAGGEPVGELLRQALEQANHQIVEQSRARKSDMGTTCVSAMIIGNNAWFANVGDSRGYLYRDGKLEQITEDHSLAWRLVQAGQLAREDIRTFDRRNEIYRSLGDDLRMEIDLFSVKLRPYDVLLLCSDGLWEMVNEEDINGKPGIASIIEHSADPHDAVEKLLAAANASGGEDNIGVVIAQLLVSDDEEGR